jgi:hypothetical protein
VILLTGELDENPEAILNLRVIDVIEDFNGQSRSSAGSLFTFPRSAPLSPGLSIDR